MQMSFYPWEVNKYEKGLDYYKSLKSDYVCGLLIHKGKGLLKQVESVIEKEQEDSSDEDQDQNFKLDEVDESMYNHRTTTSFVSSPDDPPSKKKLFYDTDFQTHKVRFYFTRIISVVYYNRLVSLKF